MESSLQGRGHKFTIKRHRNSEAAWMAESPRISIQVARFAVARFAVFFVSSFPSPPIPAGALRGSLSAGPKKPGVRPKLTGRRRGLRAAAQGQTQAETE